MSAYSGDLNKTSKRATLALAMSLKRRFRTLGIDHQGGTRRETAW
jgi:hypothetical protein